MDYEYLPTLIEWDKEEAIRDRKCHFCSKTIKPKENHWRLHTYHYGHPRTVNACSTCYAKAIPKTIKVLLTHLTEC